MSNQEMKLYAFQPNGYGQYSFFVMVENETEAIAAVERHIEETFVRPAICRMRVSEPTFIN